MALTLNFFTGRLLGRNEKITPAKLNAIVKGMSATLGGSVGVADLAAADYSTKLTGGAYWYAAGTLAAGTYTAAYTPAVTSYADGLLLAFKASAANTGAVSLDAGGGAKSLRRADGTVLLANEILANQTVVVRYNSTLVAGGVFQVVSPLSAVVTGVFTSPLRSIPGSAAVLTEPHGLAARPRAVRVVLVNNTAAAEAGYAQNDELDAASAQVAADSNANFAFSCDATNVYVSQINSAVVRVIPRTGGAFTSITVGNWALKIYANV